jgi:hypothetical protein
MANSRRAWLLLAGCPIALSTAFPITAGVVPPASRDAQVEGKQRLAKFSSKAREQRS